MSRDNGLWKLAEEIRNLDREIKKLRIQLQALKEQKHIAQRKIAKLLEQEASQ